MRKVVLFVVSMCCMVSAFAQQTRDGQELLKQMQSKIKQVEKWNRYANTFSEQLDSVYGDFQKSVFEYDERFNCVKIDYYWFDEAMPVNQYSYMRMANGSQMNMNTNLMVMSGLPSANTPTNTMRTVTWCYR